MTEISMRQFILKQTNALWARVSVGECEKTLFVFLRGMWLFLLFVLICTSNTSRLYLSHGELCLWWALPPLLVEIAKIVDIV